MKQICLQIGRAKFSAMGVPVFNPQTNNVENNLFVLQKTGREPLWKRGQQKQEAQKKSQRMNKKAFALSHWFDLMLLFMMDHSSDEDDPRYWRKIPMPEFNLHIGDNVTAETYNNHGNAKIRKKRCRTRMGI